MAKRQLHYQAIKCSDTGIEAGSECFYPHELDYPKRPKWDYTMSKQELDQSENRYFRKFCEDIDINFVDENLCKYELNLETWRQLWRVTEISDVLLIIVDARYPVLQFPPYLYDDLVNVKKKDVILVLNKCDLIPPSLVVAWKKYFSEKYRNLSVVPFFSLEGAKSTRGLLRMAKNSSLKLVDACQNLVGDEVDISGWRRKIEEEIVISPEAEQHCVIENEKVDQESFAYKKFNNNVLTIGTIGHPNVGKSSLINALMGKKVVSVSRTPGHTKHFQTIYLTKSVRLCDCPGLVFPSISPVELQVISGSYPIAQYSDPLGALHYVGTLIDLPKRLNLQQCIENDNRNEKNAWSSFNIADAWAIKRGYFMKMKGARPDVNRSSNELLRFTLSGNKNLVISIKPPNYHKNKSVYESDQEIDEIKKIQGLYQSKILEKKEKTSKARNNNSNTNSDEDEEEEEIDYQFSTNRFSLLDID